MSSGLVGTKAGLSNLLNRELHTCPQQKFTL
jgi:hypothetical protein